MLKEKLRQARKAAGLTQLQVAKAIGVTESTYCGYETGKRQPDPMKISAIASVLGVSGDFLLDINLPENKKKPAPESRHDELYNLLSLLSDDDLDDVLEFVRYKLSKK